MVRNVHVLRRSNLPNLETGGVVRCSFEKLTDHWNILTNRIHGSFSSRSTIPIWEILCFVCLSPTKVSPLGANVVILCLFGRPRVWATATLKNISVFILVWHVLCRACWFKA